MAGEFLRVSQVVIEFVIPSAAGVPLAISGVPPNGFVGSPYGPFCYTASGGTPPYVGYALVGLLPPGLVLDPVTGCLSGIPQRLGAFPFSIQVTDSLGAVAVVASVIMIVGIDLVINFMGAKVYQRK